MKYNAKYDRWVSKDGLVYRYDKKNDKLSQCNLTKTQEYAYVSVSKPKRTRIRVNRLIYETFVGPIPNGYQIDHINTIRDDNRLENLRCVTPKENCNNQLTRKHISDSQKGISRGKGKPANNKGKPRSEFGTKFKEHYGITRYQNTKLYHKECCWYLKHNKVCRWEVEQ